MADVVSDQFILRVKAATRDLVRLVGGVIRAGEIASHSKTAVSRWQTVDNGDVIDLCSAIALEVECGVPLVTTVMAEATGRRVSDDADPAAAASLMERHADLMRASAETAMRMAEAMADHMVTPAEAEILDRSLAEQEAHTREMRGALAGIRAAGPAPAATPLRSFRAV